jgi:Tfp pilus assembly pilus retraction ATPase PilT
MIANVQALPQTPVAAPSAAGLKSFFSRTGHAVWATLHAVGAARARKELTRLADAQQHINPELAAHLRRVVREDWLLRG